MPAGGSQYAQAHHQHITPQPHLQVAYCLFNSRTAMVSHALEDAQTLSLLRLYEGAIKAPRRYEGSIKALWCRTCLNTH